MTETLTRRERAREATYAEIVSTSRALLRDGSELSLRAVAGRMGITPPALYRYVASYQELVDLVAYEIDKSATEEFRAAAATQDEDDLAGQLVCAAVAFRRWALRDRAEFMVAFANPVAESNCLRRELLTASTSGHYFNDLLVRLWRQRDFPRPDLDDLDPRIAEVMRDPIYPADVSAIPAADRGLLWVFQQAWATLYGTVTLEVFGHMDPRVIDSGELFAQMLLGWMPRLAIDDPDGHYTALLRSEIARD
ncbi:TetR/AcrR family transcriptional regulator [Nocardioides aestuarii]|uniref:TetR/AcrR family transcriptional regulator n=1 Tax=Nocardioides aestuarii TaxID=252231 RepID=A0ABW4TKU2_9ACTN